MPTSLFVAMFWRYYLFALICKGNIAMAITQELADIQDLALPEIRVDVSPTGFFQRFDLSETGITHGILQAALSLRPGSPVARETHEHDVVEVWPRLGRDALRQLFGDFDANVTFSPRADLQLTQEQALNTA